MLARKGLKVHYATFLRAVNKQKNRVLDARNSSLAGANMTFRRTFKTEKHLSLTVSGRSRKQYEKQCQTEKEQNKVKNYFKNCNKS